MGDSKPKTFRIDEETASRFKEIAASLGGNQQETMASLINAYEMLAGKNSLAGSKENIEKFGSYCNAITRMYLTALEGCSNAKELAYKEFEGLLHSKDKVIQEQQAKINGMLQERDQAVQAKSALVHELELLQERIDREYEPKLADMQGIIHDKERIISTLTEAHEATRAKISEYDKTAAALSNAQAKITEMQEGLNRKELDHEKALLRLKQEHMEQVVKLKEEYLRKLESYIGAASGLETAKPETDRVNDL